MVKRPTHWGCLADNAMNPMSPVEIISQSPPPPSPRRSQPRTDYDPEMVGRSLEHSYKALGLGLGATETEVKVAYRALARIYHPDKHDPARTGMTHADASEYFKLINNAQAYLCEVL